MKTFPLLPEERKDLMRLGKQIKDVKGAIRMRVILALDAGYTIKEVADILLLDENTVSKWKKNMRRDNFFLIG